LSQEYKDSYKEHFLFLEATAGEFAFVKGNEANEAKYNMLGTVECTLGRLGITNRNGRVYSEEFWRELFKSERFLFDLKNRRLTGEMEHPAEVTANGARISHVVTKVWIEGDRVKGWVEIFDTPMGRILETLLRGGVLYGISSRGYGGSENKEGVEYILPNEFVMKGWDFVQDPSTIDGYVHTASPAESKNLERAVQSLKDPRASLGKLVPCFEKFIGASAPSPAIHGVVGTLADKVSGLERENRILRSEREYTKEEIAKLTAQIKALTESLSEKEKELERLGALKGEVKRLEGDNEKIRSEYARALQRGASSSGGSSPLRASSVSSPVHHVALIAEGAQGGNGENRYQSSRLGKLLYKQLGGGL